MKVLNFILLITLLSINGCSQNQSQNVNNEVKVLKDVYQDAFLIGTAVTPTITSGRDKASQDIIKKHFNSITVENVMKAETLNPRPGVYNFGPADEFVAFGKQNDMQIIAHTLVWHNQCPDWFFMNEDGSPKSPELVKQRLHDYIKEVASRYDGKVHAWDVVNEVIGEDGQYRPTKWVNAIGNGDTLVKLSFQYAAQYTPKSELYYNDFNAWRPEKVQGIVKMVKMLQSEGIKIDGIGIQGHWGLNFPKNKYIEDAIDAYAALGVKVMITELDVDVLPLTKEGQIIGTGMLHPQFQLEEFREFLNPYADGLPKEIEELQAKRYKELFEIFLAKKDKIDRVTFWGVHDGMSWKNDYPIDKRINYPLLWTRDKKPKAALNELLKLEK
jgi:endo-1,4-beta-xylanase